jgi:hypothetical protein
MNVADWIKDFVLDDDRLDQRQTVSKLMRRR